MTTFVLRFEPAKVELPCDEAATLLDTALAAGFFPKHSCRRGECGACETRIVSGEVRYAEGAKTSEIKSGHCLTCLAIPVSDVVLDAPEVSSEPGRRIIRTGVRVKDVERVSSDVTVVRAQAPTDSGFDFQAGQYVDVILRNGARRSYSMANAPASDGVIEWHIRAMPGGRFSPHVYEKLKSNDLLKIEGPYGGFALRNTRAPLIFLASGTGYAPISSLMRTHRASIAERGAAFYWGGRRLADLYAMEEALAWARSAPGLSFVPVLSDPHADWTGRTGFVHEAVLRDHPDLSRFEVYACGNPLMVDAARHVFQAEAALSPENFMSDAFVTAIPA